MEKDYIFIKGAREHNLKNIDLRIPRNALVVITGLSGSGKSSLAFDTLYAEGQRRYVESLSAYARQFLEQLQKPDVDYIEGLSPAIAIEQRSAGANPRSTVGTVTELYDYLRLLFARIGIQHCHKCDQPISRQSANEIVERILKLPRGSKIMLLAPLVRGRRGEYQDVFKDVKKDGFVRVRVDGALYDLDSKIRLNKKVAHNIEIVVDRLGISEEIKRRLTDSVETALKVGKGTLLLSRPEGDKLIDVLYSELYACSKCGLSFQELQPRVFSFNSPYGACPACSGLGTQMDLNPLWRPWRYHVSRYCNIRTCSKCNGARLKDESLSVYIGGKNILGVVRLSILEAARFFDSLVLSTKELDIAGQILKEIKSRLHFLHNVGLDYLTLERLSSTLSGGEAQRIRLATQIGSGLVGVLYILDEPSIGLHQRDNAKLLNTLESLRNLGNTLLVVEHDEPTIRRADYIVDLGPGAGKEGGRVVACGSLEAILKSDESLTGRFLRGELKIELPHTRRPYRNKPHIKIVGASEHNLKNIDVKIPLGLFTCVTGVSGSGKSTLVDEILYRGLRCLLYNSKERAGAHKKILGAHLIKGVVVIDQSPIGRTPRSNPATYTKLFDHIRSLFAKLPESRARGYLPGRFSFNVKGGRCEECAGDGLKRIEMHFLPDVYVRCEACLGRRYNQATLEVTYKGRSIADVLKMPVSEALEFFRNIPALRQRLQTLYDVGLGYVELGQSATTLSGGEAQRVKLASELVHRTKGNTLYILDEPTTGLHFADVAKLLSVLHRLVDLGNTVLVIEHNLDVVKTADFIIDLGPEGGDEGGYVVAAGAPEELCGVERSYTGQYLKKYLEK